jgi:hypothetical protein
MGVMGNVGEILTEKPLRKKESKFICSDNNKMHLSQIGREALNQVRLTRRLAVANTVINTRVTKTMGKFLTSYITIIFILHEELSALWRESMRSDRIKLEPIFCKQVYFSLYTLCMKYSTGGVFFTKFRNAYTCSFSKYARF